MPAFQPSALCNVPSVNDKMQALAQRSSLVARPCCRSAARAFLPSRSVCVARASNKKQEQVQKDVSGVEVLGSLSSPALAALFSYVLTEAPASAVALSDSSPFAGVASNSLYVTLGLFVMCVPGEMCGARATCSGSAARRDRAVMAS